MMYGHEKSDSVIVALKLTNKTERSAAELVERRAGTEGNVGQMKHVLDSVPAKRVTGVGSHTATFRRRYPRWEPYAGKPHVRIWTGGREVTRVPTAKDAVCCGA